LTNGSFGIGTTSPGATLGVEGNGLFSGNLNVASLTATGTLQLSSIGKNMIITSDANGNLIASSTPTVAAIFATSTMATSTFNGGFSGPNNLTIQSSSGFVGIGTSSPAY